MNLIFVGASGAKLPNATEMISNLHRHLPRVMADDYGASWREWPMRYRPAMP